MFLLTIAVALAFGVGCMGRNRKIGFGLAFFLALINFFIGLIAVLCSKKKADTKFVDIQKEDEKK